MEQVRSSYNRGVTKTNPSDNIWKYVRIRPVHEHTVSGQMLQMFSRFEFNKAVKENGAECHAGGFASWNHFVFMLLGQLAGQDRLRGIEAGLGSNERIYICPQAKGAIRSARIQGS